MELFNQAATYLFSLLLYPVSKLDPVWGLATVSLVAGVLLAALYGKISNQRALKAVKRGITVGMFESVLFRHDLRTSLTAQAMMLWGGIKYFALAIPPIAVLMVPSILILAQLNLRYGANPLTPGEPAILTMTVANEDILFEADAKPSGAISLTPPIRDLDSLQVSWRIEPKQSGSPHETLQPAVLLSVAGSSAEQPIYVGSRPTTLPTELHASPLWQFLYPGGSVPEALKKSVKAISVGYPEASFALAGLHAHWLMLFLCISLAAGFVASKVLGIEI